MNRSTLIPLGVGALLGLALTSGPTPSRPASGAAASEVRRAIEAGNAIWERAFRGSDPAAIAWTFDEEGINVGVDGSCMKGRAAIESAMRSYLDRSGPATDTKVEIGDIVLDGDLAYEWGRSAFHFSGKSGGPTERAGRYLAVWKRQPDGGWKLLRNLGLPGRM